MQPTRGNGIVPVLGRTIAEDDTRNVRSFREEVSFFPVIWLSWKKPAVRNKIILAV